MNAKKLYAKLDKDFGIAILKDDWSFMKFSEYIAPHFKKRFMGIALDNTAEVKKVYTATFPDLVVLEKLIHTDQTDILLFSHHAMGYDPTIAGFPFYDIPEDYLSKLKQKRISFYMLHTPLDKNGEYSTSVNLAKNLNLEIIDEFCEYEGIKCGVVCKTNKKTATELAEYVRSIVDHEVKLIRNGDDIIHDGRVGVAAGGGSVGFAAKELSDLGINMYITGCTRLVPSVEPIMEFHRITKEREINVIGATHYTTEKYACIAMVRYFEKLGIQAEFLEGRYYLEDL
jgi:putative NIF3 family GTP cyclohydrolase 1 type 2